MFGFARRWNEIKTIWLRYPALYAVPGLVTGLAIGFLIGATMNFGSGITQFVDGIWPEVIGITFTAFVIDQINRWQEKQRSIRERNERLIRQIGSTVNDVAKDAAHQAQKLRLLKGENGLLKGADLLEANLRDAHLRGANLTNTDLLHTDLTIAHLEFAILTGANLNHANLTDANLNHADLTGADLLEANLEGAKLGGAKLIGATLEGADLKSALMIGVDLCGANLKGANLAGTRLEGIFNYKFNKQTILPDGSSWAPGTDMTRYTNPNHPDFWQPE